MFKKRSLKQGSGVKRKKVSLSENSEDESAKETTVPEVKGKSMMGLENSAVDRRRVSNSEIRDDDDDKFKLLSGEQEVKTSGEEPVNFKMKDRSAITQPKNVKVSILTDFHPDVCKDFKQTGYCGYGDSCKFLHSRDDFKTGWQMNQDWKIGESSSSKDNKPKVEGIPFKCVICKGDYKSPIVTNCEHYFCGMCFTQRVRKDPNCAICGQDTHGVAKIAKNLKSILRDQKQSQDI
ncbi:RNA-splicing factor [Zygosaccharomyces mellis]|uniref:Pre-mRNA-splicing factor CWC24 n=1 Tax=Zygosaccharomyces mellis TaxID=42258 RepID=A0A4C2E6V7_9SACH|nr:RNA-splicing factor [Zygosaccharomyces mellis]